MFFYVFDRLKGNRISSLLNPKRRGLLVVLLCYFALGACTQKQESSRVTIRMPNLPEAKQSSSNPTRVSKGAQTQAANWDSAIPTALNDIGCFGVFVGGPGLTSNSCKNADGNDLAQFGAMKGFVPRGGLIDLEVSPGNRTVYVFGSKLVSGSCVNLFTGSDPPFSNFSTPYILGKTTLDLRSGPQDVTVSLEAAFTSATRIGDCTFSGNSQANKFGSGADGNVSIDNNNNFYTGTSTYTDGSGRLRVFNASRRLKSISSSDPYLIELHTAYSSTGTIDFTTGDEIMWWVTGANQSGGPDYACRTDGTSNTYRGRYGFARVLATPDTTHLRLDSILFSNPNNTNLAASTAGSPFCAVQIVRVPNFDNLTLAQTAGVSFFATPYGSATAMGGILAFRVKTGVMIEGNYSVLFQANGAGYEGGGTNSSGSSNIGAATGGGAGNSGGGAGGANAGAGGNGNSGSSMGAAANTYCNGNTICSPAEKIFMGSGGGGTSGNGGAGGGVIYASIKSLAKSAVSSTAPYFYANGEGAPAAAGGGGGTIYLNIRTNAVTFAGMSANGTDGNSGLANGGGGGGSALINYCTSTSTISPSVTGGAAGNGSAVAGGAGQANVNANICD